MITYLSASKIFPVSSEALEKGVIAVDDNHRIIGIFSAEQAKSQGIRNVKFYEGILVPGLINTHCHLELSHLKGVIPEHTGLPGFVQQVIKQRAASAEDIETAMARADQEMVDNGIVATGDISNQAVSRTIKMGSKIYYHTFVEAMGFNPANAADIMDRAKQLKDSFLPMPASVIPHAPYSVSEPLFNEIRTLAETDQSIISIHNQETSHEDEFFSTGSGHFLELYKFLGLDISFFKPQGKSSIQCYLPQLANSLRTLLVHNTFTAKEDLDFAQRNHENLYWCLCPNANLYIENRLPDVSMLRDSGATITLGTDSLASNHQLSILSEMLTLQEQAEVPFEELLKWATLNGAMFLGTSHVHGSFDPGKAPGINLITRLKDGMLTRDSTIRPLF